MEFGNIEHGKSLMNYISDSFKCQISKFLIDKVLGTLLTML